MEGIVTFSLFILTITISLSSGLVHNPFFNIFGPISTGKASSVPKSKDMGNDPPLQALLFMSRVEDHNDKDGRDSEDRDRVQPSPPKAITKLFSSVDMPDTQSKVQKEPKGRNRIIEGFPSYIDPYNAHGRSAMGSIKGHKHLQKQKSEEKTEDDRVVPALFGSPIEGHHKKLRRTRNRNSHRKQDQRHVASYITAHTPSHTKRKNTNKKTYDIIKKQHRKRSSNVAFHHRVQDPNQETEDQHKKGNIDHVQDPKLIRHHSSQRSRGSKTKESVAQILSDDEKLRPQKGRKISKPAPVRFSEVWLLPGMAHVRAKRAAWGLKQLSYPAYTYDQSPPSGRTFLYRMPAGGVSSRRGKLSHGHLLRTETENNEDAGESQQEEKQKEEEGGGGDAEFITHTKTEAREKDGDLPVPRSAELSDNAPKDVPQQASPNEGIQEISSDNATLGGVNGSVPRHLLRSPMLVDYGSRVRPQDIVLPTEPAEEPAEEEQVGVSEEGEESDALLPDPREAGESEHDPAFDLPDKETPEVEPALEKMNSDPEPSQPETETVHIRPPHVEDDFPVPEEESLDPEPEPEPEAEAESHPNPAGDEEDVIEEEPEGEKSKTRSEPTSEPEGESGEPGPEVVAYAEQQPEWEVAKEDWGPWWEVHIYGIGFAYAVLCAYSFISIIRLWRRKNLLSQGYFMALNCIMFMLGFFRALYFLVDGYNSHGTFTAAGHYFLYSIGFPCLTSAFSILLLALLNTLKMQFVSSKIQRTSVLIGIIAGHFLFSILTDVIVGYVYKAKVMMFVCQITTVLWGLFLFIGYIYVFRKLYKAAVWRQNELMRLSLAKIKMDGIAPITKPPRMTLNVAIKVTLSTAIFGLLLAALQTYGIFGVGSIFSDDKPDPWTWLLYNTSLRLTELAMCITMSYVATQPFRYKQSGKMDEHQSSCVNALFYMAPCRRMFECDSASLYGDDLDYTDFPTHGDLDQQDGGHNTAEESTPMTASGRAAQAAAAAAAAAAVAGQSERENSLKKSNKVVPRPASLLVSENGFIRFREDEESGGSPVLLSTDDELENNSMENMLRNPFYRDLLRRQEKERAVGRATFVNSDGITLQDEFGLAESITDQELIPPPRPTFPIRASSRGCSYPNTGTNTPGTPRSFCSTDLEYAASEISYRPPSSIHLRDSIENALNIPGFTLKTPDLLDSPLTMAYIRTRRGSLRSRGSRPTGSMNDLESLRHYGPVSKYSDSHDTIDYPSERAASPDSMYSYTLSNLTRAPLVRSYSDSIGRTSLAEASVPNSPERQYYKARVHASMLKNNPENSNQFQNLLRNINDMCNAYNKLSPDDREGDE